MELLKVSEEAKPREFSKQRWQDCVELWVAERDCSGSGLDESPQDIAEVSREHLGDLILTPSCGVSWELRDENRP